MNSIAAFLDKKVSLDAQRIELESRKLEFEMQKWEAAKAQQSAQTELLIELLKQQKR